MNRARPQSQSFSRRNNGVSILEHEMNRARRRRFNSLCVVLQVSILEHEMNRARPSRAGHARGRYEVSILEHEMNRARQLAFRGLPFKPKFQSSSTK